jgi:hypothetical protein
MAFGATSKIFSAYLHDVLTNLTAMDLDTDALIEVALFNDNITPSQTVTAANSAYGAGVWTGGATPNIVDTGTGGPAGWPYLGLPLASKAVSAATAATFTFGAANLASTSGTTTLTDARGCLAYDKTISTPVDLQGIAYLSFNGSNTCTLGTFTIVWASGLLFSIAL